MSQALSKAKSNEILVRQDRSRRHHFATSAALTSSVQKFEVFQKLVLERGMKELPPVGCVLACLLAFDSLASPQDLERAYEASKLAERWDGRVRIAWVDEGRIDARYLSDMTVVAHMGNDKWPPYADVAQEVERFAVLHLGSHTTLLGIVESGAMWLQLHLAPVLFGHVLKTAPMAGLGASVLARERTGRALLTGGSNPPINERRTIDRISARTIEAAMLGRSPSVFGGARFLAELSIALRPPTKGSNAAKRATVLDKLSGLVVKLDSEDEVVAAIFAYALDLLANGTWGKRELAPGTPAHYVGSFAEKFRNQMIGQRFQTIKEKDYALIYTAILDSDGHVAPYLHAGLKGFHRFLRQWLDVPKLPKDIFGAADAVVEANVIWPHELDRVFGWLQDAPKSRLVLQLEVALAIAVHGMIRIAELQLLRIKNIIQHKELIEIEISREIRDGREKSKEGRRRLTVADGFAREKIDAWLARRTVESATKENYLFGDPVDPSRVAYRGHMQVWLNKLLKAATGDTEVSFHTLRHTRATNRAADFLCSPNNGEVSELDLLANEAGHAGGHTTCRYYVHRFENALRLSVDRALSTRTLPYAAFEAWSGLSQATLRQRVSRERKRSSPLGTLWESVAQRAMRVQLKCRDDGLKYEDPVNPLVVLVPEALQFRQVVGALSDVACRQPLTAAELRNDLSRDELGAILEATGRFAGHHGERILGLPDFVAAGVDALRDSSGRRLGLTPDFRRTRQVRWRNLAKAVSRSDKDQLQTALHFWRAGLQSRHLAVRAGHGLGQFLALIKHAGIPAGQLSLFWAPPSSDESESLCHLNDVQATSRATFGSSISVRRKSFRAGRPVVWLVVSSSVGDKKAEGSANSMVGLHCVLFAAHIWQSLQKITREEVV